jgi:penicillin-binding protein 1C
VTTAKKVKAWKTTAALTAAVVFLCAIFFTLDAAFPLPYGKLEKDYSTLHLASDSSLLRISLSKSGKYRLKMRLGDFSQYTLKGFLAYEDKFFYMHPGVNPAAIIRAAFLNATEKRVISGGSTISMQVIKMIEPRERNIGSKIIEAFRALQLEAHYGKKKTFEIYLNTVPMGGNIEGVGAASYIYFNKSPADLTPAEAALLIAIPRSPVKNRPDAAGAKNARDAVLDRIHDAIGISASMLRVAKAEPTPLNKFHNPYILPHLVNKKLSRDSFVRKYFIDMNIQAMAENIIKRSAERLAAYGVNNCAVIVVKNNGLKVVAYMGSPDFYDSRHCGQVDCASIPRSPGSALKPFVYGLALDKGIITPKSVVFDIPRDYGGYRPVDFEKKFRGPVTAESALTMSLNIPAVHLEYTMGREGLLGLLKRVGIFSGLRASDDPGLSVVLGAFPVSLEELVTLYTSLACGGEIRPLNYIENGGGEPEPQRLMSGEAAYIISEMLASGERPDLPQSWEFTPYRGKVAFKTGTSFGLRDAWCVGYNPDYTVGVWFGNADASPSFELVGIKTAAPVVMEIFNYLSRQSDSWFEKPERVKKRMVCASSGMPPNDNCPAVNEDMYIEGVSSVKKCDVHRIIYLDRKSGKRIRQPDAGMDPYAYEKKVVEEWPVDVATFLREHGGQTGAIPVYGNQENYAEGGADAPRILSPQDGSVFIINKAIKEQYRKIALKAAVASGNGEIYWFLNGSVTATAKPQDTVFLALGPGDWEITVQDSFGGVDKAGVKVLDEKN